MFLKGNVCKRRFNYNGHNIQSACTYLKFRLYLQEVNKQVEGHHLATPLDYFAAYLNKFYSNVNVIILYFSVMPKYSSNCKVLLKRADKIRFNRFLWYLLSRPRSTVWNFLPLALHESDAKGRGFAYLTNTAITYLCIFSVQQMIYNIIIIYKSPNPYMCNLFHNCSQKHNLFLRLQ